MQLTNNELSCDILTIGTGLVSSCFCYDLALVCQKKLRICILGRQQESVEKTVIIANARASSFSSPVQFFGDTINWDQEQDLADKLVKYNPRLVFITSSLQSPWEFTQTKSAWTSLVEHCGFGVTLPLQAALAARVSAAIKNNIPNSLLVNVCYPDAVNPLLKFLDLPITCGVGNIGFLSTLLKSELSLDSDKLQIIVHHADLYSSTSPQSLKVWIEDKLQPNLPQVDKALSLIKRYVESDIDRLTLGVISAEVLLALLEIEATFTHVPSPNGLPGGYPVVICDSKVKLNLPSDCSEEEAIALNKQAFFADGIEALDDNGFVAFTPKTSSAIEQYFSSLSSGFYAKDLQAVTQKFLKLREKLRQTA